jgi:hypothetical protein
VRRTGRRLCFHRCPFLSRKIWWPFFLERFILHCRRPGLVLSLQEQFQFFFPGFDFFGSRSCHKRCSQGELFPLVLLPSQPTVQFSMPFSFLLALWRSVFAALTVGTAFPLGGCSGHASPHRSRAKRAGPCTSSSSYSASADRSPDSICVAHKRLCLSIPQSAH